MLHLHQPATEGVASGIASWTRTDRTQGDNNKHPQNCKQRICNSEYMLCDVLHMSMYVALTCSGVLSAVARKLTELFQYGHEAYHCRTCGQKFLTE